MTERLANKLKARAAAWAGQLTQLARGMAPSHVRPAISSRVEQKDNGQFIIRITADRRIAPDARAQEFGSGLRARRGPKHTYVIKPKTKKVLAFFWDVLDNEETQQNVFDSPKFVGFAPDGRGLFRYVDHPGIEAANEGKGYIAPAMRELHKKAKQELEKDIREAILGDLRESFGRKLR